MILENIYYKISQDILDMNNNQMTINKYLSSFYQTRPEEGVLPLEEVYVPSGSQNLVLQACQGISDFSLYRYVPWELVQLNSKNIMDKPIQRGIVYSFWFVQTEIGWFLIRYLSLWTGLSVLFCTVKLYSTKHMLCTWY